MTAGRNGSMDTARGIAVAGMIVAHFVPLDGLGTAGAKLIDGTPAALFFVLIGMAWAIQADRKPDSWRLVIRRSLALLVLGLLLHRLVWPTEVLVPYAVMLGPALLIRRGGRWALFSVIAGLMVLSVVGAGYFAQFSKVDWSEDGSSYLADSSFGWQTLRYLLFNGNYPVIPWLAFPLIGMLFVRDGKVLAQYMGRIFGLAVSLSAVMAGVTFWTESHGLGSSIYWSTTWVPTTLPFMLLKTGFVLAIMAGLSYWQVCWRWVAPVGRASLTHYLAHICLVFVVLRHFFPEEDWPARIGLMAAGAYWVVAVPLSVWWFRSHKRGPVEGVLAWASGTNG